MAKKRAIGRYPNAFRKMAVEQLKSCDNIVALSDELGVHRRLLYKWPDQLEPIDDGESEPENGKERELRLPVAQPKRLMADKTLEADFFEARCQNNRKPGETASTTKSGSCDVDARQPEYRADVSIGQRKPCRVLSVAARAEAG